MIDYLEQGRTINSRHYEEELRRLRQEIAREMREKMTQGRSTPTQQCASSHIQNCDGCCHCFRLLNSSSSQYSSYLAHSDFYLFPKLKTKLRGRCSGRNISVMRVAIELFEDQNREFYLKG
jgi:hypothetical protein